MKNFTPIFIVSYIIIISFIIFSNEEAKRIFFIFYILLFVPLFFHNIILNRKVRKYFDMGPSEYMKVAFPLVGYYDLFFNLTALKKIEKDNDDYKRLKKEYKLVIIYWILISVSLFPILIFINN